MTESRRRGSPSVALGVMVGLLVVGVLTAGIQPTTHARASACRADDSRCAESTTSAAKKRPKADDGVLDKIGLGSLEDLPWQTLPLALGLAALIGAAGGFVYAGLVGNIGTRGDDSPSS